MQLPLQNFSTLVANAAAAVQGAAEQLIDLTVGSVLRAVLEANASLALWMQWLIVLVLQTTRAATSTGVDLDTWMADFALTRLPASAAAGQVQFSRFEPTASALVPAGTQVRTADGSQTFTVGVDTTNPLSQASLNGYLLPAATASASVPITAVVAGSAGNVLAGSITLIAAALPGIDTVANAALTTGGLDAESDAALRARFQLYIAALSRGVPAAIGSAVTSVQQGLSYAVLENTAPDGVPMPGVFVVAVDDGSGTPPQSLLDQVAQAVEPVRPVGTSFSVVPPTLVAATVSMVLAVQPAYDPAVVIAAVQNALLLFINALPVGAALPYSRLAQIAYDASPGVTNVSAIGLNGTTNDLVPGAAGVVRTSAVLVN
jgi:uncharacterized phage protein gp47/JayE